MEELEVGHVPMLPVVTETIREQVEAILSTGKVTEWKKEMVHRLKQVNPEINALLLQVAQGAQDPKAVVLAGYAVYQAIELAMVEEEGELI